MYFTAPARPPDLQNGKHQKNKRRMGKTKTNKNLGEKIKISNKNMKQK
jgi:hypothetical protein